jgi:hypothetical protein
VSLDDGDDWQPLRLNMPATSVRDLVVHGDDLVVGTHGRSFWILDDVTPLRQLDAGVTAAEAHLFRPQTAYRVRWNVNPDTPLPPDEPAGQNPPDGAVLDYYLKAAAPGPVTLEVLDGQGKLVRRFSSADTPPPVDEKSLTIAAYWLRPPQLLSAAAGAHRFVWDLHYPPPEGGRRSYPMTAVYRDTPSVPQGRWVLPGEYRVRLTVGDHSHEQPLTVRMDPRVPTPAEGLRQQFELSLQCVEGLGRAQAALAQVRKLRGQLRELRTKAGEGKLGEELTALDGKAAALEGTERRRGERPPDGTREPTLARLAGELQRLLEILQGADTDPTTQVVDACGEAQKGLRTLLERWQELTGREVKAVNERLRQAGLVPLAP